MRYVLLLAVAVAAAGCGGAREAHVVPDVRGQRLDRAERLLGDQKLDWTERGADGLGVLVRSNWTVCEQRPAPGKLAGSVELSVGKTCMRDPSETPPTAAPAAAGGVGES